MSRKRRNGDTETNTRPAVQAGGSGKGVIALKYYKEKFGGSPNFTIYATEKSLAENKAIAIYYDDYWGCDPYLAKFVEYPEESWFEGIAAAEFYRIDAYLIDPRVPWSPDNDSEIRRIWWEPEDSEEILQFCM